MLRCALPRAVCQRIADVLPDLLGNQADSRVFVAHLGNGDSLCGRVSRKIRATTMGFTLLDRMITGKQYRREIHCRPTSPQRQRIGLR